MEKTRFNPNTQVSKDGWRDHGETVMSYGPFSHTANYFSKGGCKVLVSREDHDGVMRWHLSISRPERYPGWNEIKDARYALLPDAITVAQILPPKAQYTNIHPNCFHLWEINDGEW